MSTNPVQPFSKEAQYKSELSSFSDLNILFRNFATKKLRPSRSSPPIAADIGEMEWVVDKTTKKLWIKIDGSLYSVTFS